MKPVKQVRSAQDTGRIEAEPIDRTPAVGQQATVEKAKVPVVSPLIVALSNTPWFSTMVPSNHMSVAFTGHARHFNLKGRLPGGWVGRGTRWAAYIGWEP